MNSALLLLPLPFLLLLLFQLLHFPPAQSPSPNKTDSDIEITFVVLGRPGVSRHCCASCILRANLNSSYTSPALTTILFSYNKTVSHLDPDNGCRKCLAEDLSHLNLIESQYCLLSVMRLGIILRR